MNDADSNNEAQKRQLRGHLWSRLSTWIFAPVGEPPPEHPDPQMDGYDWYLNEYDRRINKRKALHDETSKTIKRVFYTLVGTCLFCIITLAGSPDSQLITAQAVVTLPILNYQMGFKAFLVVGPAILIGLTIYLHIFVAQHRLVVLNEEDRQPMLPNFDSWSAKLAILLIFYWIVPITLAYFAWKASPIPNGKYLFYTVIGVGTALILLQIRRCPRDWRIWGLPLLVATYAIFNYLVFSVTTSRELDLFKADLSEQDLRFSDLSGAFLIEADLTGANLSKANLTDATLIGATLIGADLTGANLTDAILVNADLTGANLNTANLTGAILRGDDIYVLQRQLDDACGNESTTLPDGLFIKPCSKYQGKSLRRFDDTSSQERNGDPPAEN